MDSLPKAMLKYLAHEACDYLHHLADLPKEKLRKIVPKASPLEVMVNVAKKVNLKRFVPDPTEGSYEFELDIEMLPKFGYYLEVEGNAHLRRNDDYN
ncbi:MAG: hypothetical protein ABIG93_00450 [archaeon]|nr:hypothetical protein [Nanoarchaeota archaeon]